MKTGSSPCANCKFRAKYDRNPKSVVGRIWRWHINFCPGFRQYFQSLSIEEQSAFSQNYHYHPKK